MACKIIWSLQARDDLREIVSFVAADNPAIAENFGYRLISKVELLANFPLLGRVVPEEADENIREIILRPYRYLSSAARATSGGHSPHLARRAR